MCSDSSDILNRLNRVHRRLFCTSSPSAWILHNFVVLAFAVEDRALLGTVSPRPSNWGRRGVHAARLQESSEIFFCNDSTSYCFDALQWGIKIPPRLQFADGQGLHSWLNRDSSLGGTTVTSSKRLKSSFHSTWLVGVSPAMIQDHPLHSCDLQRGCILVSRHPAPVMHIHGMQRTASPMTKSSYRSLGRRHRVSGAKRWTKKIKERSEMSRLDYCCWTPFNALHQVGDQPLSLHISGNQIVKAMTLARRAGTWLFPDTACSCWFAVRFCQGALIRVKDGSRIQNTEIQFLEY